MFQLSQFKYMNKKVYNIGVRALMFPGEVKSTLTSHPASREAALNLTARPADEGDFTPEQQEAQVRGVADAGDG